MSSRLCGKPYPCKQRAIKEDAWHQPVASTHLFICAHPHTHNLRPHQEKASLDPLMSTRRDDLSWDLHPIPAALIRSHSPGMAGRCLPQSHDGGAVPARCGHCLLPSAARGTCTLATKIPVVTESVTRDLRVTLVQVVTTQDLSPVSPSTHPLPSMLVTRHH